MTMSPADDFRVSRARRLSLVLIATVLLSLSSVAATTAQDDAVTPPADAPSLSVTFTEYNDSGVSGIATLFGDGDQTIIQITIENGGKRHPAHIHKGSCGDLDPTPAFPLENVDDGKSISKVDVSLDELLGGGYSIDLHMSVNELGTLILCAPLEGVATDGTGGSETESDTTPEPTTEASTTPDSVGGSGTESGDGTGGAQMSEDSASLPLTGLDGNGVTGIVSLTKLGDEETNVIIQLSGDAISGGHIAHLHLGTCDNLADEGTIDLESVNESGLSDTTVNVAFETLLEDGYAVNVHNSETDYENWLVCGEFADATVGAVIPEVAPDTGGGSTNVTPTVEAAPTTTTTTLPKTAGTGFGLPGPDSPLSASFWAILFGSSLLIAGAWLIRRGEQSNRSAQRRWRRLGL